MLVQQPETAVVRRRRLPVGATILGLIFGLLLGIGVGIFLQMLGVLDPASKKSLIAPAVGVLLGLLAGLFGGRRSRVAVAAAPGYPPQTAAPPPTGAAPPPRL